ncbi:hypothetical protein A2U01_0076714, partial [Trifolium medium]|nr:hypothetical protein [Trifolium medium]
MGSGGRFRKFVTGRTLLGEGGLQK